MKKLTSRSILFVVISLFAAVTLRADTLEVKIQMKGTSFKVGVPVMLYITYSYDGPNEILVPEDHEPTKSGIVIRHSDTKETVHRFHEGEMVRLSSKGFGVSSGHRVQESVDLTKYFMLDRPGSYTVTIDKSYGAQGKKATSNSITFALTQ
jgi:hypothetical protein